MFSTSQNFNTLEEEIIQKLNKLVKHKGEEGWINSVWTFNVLDSLEDIGTENGYKVCPSKDENGERDNPEWLVDMHWYKSKKIADENAEIADEKRLTHVGLACECEWSSEMEDIIYDFEKLICFKTVQKLMIFECPKQKTAHYFEQLIKSLNVFPVTLPNERYLLAAFTMGQHIKDNKFEFAVATQNTGIMHG